MENRGCSQRPMSNFREMYPINRERMNVNVDLLGIHFHRILSLALTAVVDAVG